MKGLVTDIIKTSLNVLIKSIIVHPLRLAVWLNQVNMDAAQSLMLYAVQTKSTAAQMVTNVSQVMLLLIRMKLHTYNLKHFLILF